ncbi:MAG: hypothetical protein HN353_05540 [Bdellovibrionales bacterium]|jgi:glucose uptake protein GlcU|nr:hypothetical protein [Bdellovibrionales bacterium]MBT3525095.1 hypothetical protein [Bdellovibrionales bacterium]MBT7670224.1 hypothetical protein [Bdellovibrionales bacterium]MBT7767696.1 hypothetical protein [Bdellovibrionales bacterium]
MVNKRTFHLLFGFTMFAAGVFGMYDEWYNVLDLVLGVAGPIMVLCGIIFMSIATKRANALKIVYLTSGLFLLLAGAFGIYDEWGVVRDVSYGIIPIISIVCGVLAVVTGVNRLKA